MSIAAVRVLSFYTVAWLEINNDLRSVIRNVTVVDQLLKHRTIKLESMLELAATKYENDIELLLESSVGRHVNPILERIEKNVDDAIADGKYVQHCYDRAIINSLESSNTDFRTMIPCLNTFHVEYERNTNYTIDLIVTVQATREHVNSIIRDCQEREDVKECIKSEVSAANQLSEEYERKARDLEISVHINYGNALNNALECISVGEEALKNEMERVERIAEKCMRQ